eukprot:TRINITY_DN1061_c0_g1_i1.p1 TRINITY_DN1061_c0_g1~~TRINITY_DN1061_c0_g1_i1.p1  ORF type:complete len:116 (+),score=18.96 TRINITY_DN1061_c0_g1_i1:81-428(+)
MPKRVSGRKTAPVRLYSKGTFTGYTRSRENLKPTSSLITIEGVKTTEDARFYLGKRVAYVYRAKKTINETKVRVIWGKVTRPHGNSGVVRAKFRTNLPPKAMGASVRVFLYPSRI